MEHSISLLSHLKTHEDGAKSVGCAKIQGLSVDGATKEEQL
jgi:hypothetical protein